MISEKRFSSEYTSFWKSLLPTIDSVVRSINKYPLTFTTAAQYEYDPRSAAVVSELSFYIYKYCHLLRMPIAHSSQIEAFVAKSLPALQRYSHSPTIPITLSYKETSAAIQIAMRINTFCTLSVHDGASPIVAPFFSGCGILEDCVADLQLGTTLYEIKNVDRSFRALDFKQLLVYCALAYSASDKTIENIGVVNPRLGIYVAVSIADFARQSSGQHPSDIYSTIIHFLSSEMASM